MDKLSGVNVIKTAENKYYTVKDRLVYIRSYYGLNMLVLFNVNVIPSESFDMLTEEEKLEYYNECCHTLLLKTRKIKNILIYLLVKKFILSLY